MNKSLWAALVLVLPLLLPVAARAMAILPPDSADDAAAFESWLDKLASRRADVAAFERFLAQEHVSGVLPVREILLTDTDWSECRTATPYTLPARADWPHIVKTLRYVRDEIVPLIGPVQVISGYRDRKLNTCAGGARHSAHAQFYAFDLVPVRGIARSKLIAQVCTNHSRNGAAYDAGLGIYEGTKFHIDTRSFRRWGPDYRAASSPCAHHEASLKPKRAKRQIAKAIPRLRLAILVD